MKQFLAIFLAILIGNPVCCCALGPGVCGDVEAPTSHSCCSFPGDSPDEDPSEPSPCGCAADNDEVTVVEVKVPHASELKRLDSDVAGSDSEFSALVQLPVAVQAIAKWPPGALVVPPMGERLALHCSYLL